MGEDGELSLLCGIQCTAPSIPMHGYQWLLREIVILVTRDRNGGLKEYLEEFTCLYVTESLREMCLPFFLSTNYTIV